jgi:hypothetical protein
MVTFLTFGLLVGLVWAIRSLWLFLTGMARAGAVTGEDRGKHPAL